VGKKTLVLAVAVRTWAKRLRFLKGAGERGGEGARLPLSVEVKKREGRKGGRQPQTLLCPSRKKGRGKSVVSYSGRREEGEKRGEVLFPTSRGGKKNLILN